MKTHQILVASVLCMLLFAGVVTIMVMNGVHLLLAITGVYILAVISMLCMQRRARESYDCGDTAYRRVPPRNTSPQSYAKDFSG